jgi:two-component system sensor histidine kinase AlgZ
MAVPACNGNLPGWGLSGSCVGYFMVERQWRQYNPVRQGDEMNRHPSLLPDFCSVRILLLLVLATELVVVAISLAADSLEQGYGMMLGLRSLYAQWLGLGSAALLCRLRPWLMRRYGPSGQSVAVLLLVSLLSLLLSALAYWMLLPAESPGLFLLRFWGASLIFTGLLLRYLYVQYLQRLQAEAEARARFQALQSRIRPHFLFNSMNTIAGLARSNAELAEEVVEDLADLFRASLSEAERLSTLEEELELARRYLHIEGLRLGDRLRVEWQLGELPLRLALPRLMLQPLLENAVYHGIENRLQTGLVRICAESRDGWLELELSNPLPAAEDESVANQRHNHGMALENVRSRLAALYQGKARLQAVSQKGRFIIQLSIPVTDDAHTHSR